jgi:hypothetical protein
VSVTITIRCERAIPHGVCAVALPTSAATVPEARAYARACGWHTARHGDYCPGHGAPEQTAPRSPTPIRRRTAQ